MSKDEQERDKNIEYDFPGFDGEFIELSVISHTDRRSSFKGMEAASSRWVFIKMLSEYHSKQPDMVEFFYNEPNILSFLSKQVDTPSIVPILRTSSWQERPYFVQPYVLGWSLSKAMERCAAFNINLALEVIQGSLELLVKIHSAGIVHGDVSPENIYIATESPVRTDGTLPTAFSVSLIDFESARRVQGSENQRYHHVIAKAPYLAPEVAKGMPLSPQADLFGLGIVLYELLIGSRPYEVKTIEDVRNLSPDSVKAIPMVYNIPKLVEDLVFDIIAPNPIDRIQSASEVLNRLREFKDLVKCLNSTKPREVNSQLGRGKDRKAADYVDTTTRDGIRREQLTWRKPVEYISAPIIRSDLNLRSDTIMLNSAPPVTNMRRVEISSYLSVPLLDSKREERLVDFSVFAPAEIVPGASFVLDFWAYQQDSREDMIERAIRQKRKVEVGSRGGLAAPLNVQLSICLKLDPFVVERSQEFLYWTGHTSNVSFLITAPQHLPPGSYAGKITVLHNGMLLAQLLFEVVVLGSVAGTADLREWKEKGRRVISAFASYSSKDRKEVLQRVQGITAVGVDVFLDVLSLRAGQMWEQEIVKNIKDRDAFYLFWSTHASKSKYVEREWRLALKERGLDFIHPIPLTDPEVAPPPPELDNLHFKDIYLMCMEVQ